MFANTQMMGLDVGFPDVCLTPTPASPVPIPYPNIAVGPNEKPCRDFTNWGVSVRAECAAQTKASKDLNKAVSTILDMKSKVAKALDEVNDIFGRIEKLQTQQKKIVVSAAKMEKEVAKAFKDFDSQAKSKDPKAKAMAKALLLGKGVGLTALFLLLEGLNTSLSKEQAALEKAGKKLK